MKIFKSMKRNVLFFILPVVLLLAAGTKTLQAQPEEDPFKDILFMIIDGDYKKAISRAERYQEKDDTRRDPRPYIYASMAYYEISKDESLQKDYPRAFSEAIKNAYKASRYDKDNVYMPEHARYINELKADIMREARFEFEQGSWRKAITNAKYVSRIDPNDLSALLLRGVAEVKSRNEYQAKTTFDEADEALKNFSASDISLDAKEAYRYAILQYADLMAEEGTKDRARPYLNAVSEVYADDAEFERVYNSY